VRGGVAEGNRLQDNGGYGMSIGHKDSDNLVRGNTIIGNARGGVYAPSRWPRIESPSRTTPSATTKGGLL
jgi:parallel beta-helix repeat protein